MSNGGPPRPPPRPRFPRLQSQPPVSDTRELRGAPEREPTLAEVAGRVSAVDLHVQDVDRKVARVQTGLDTLSKFVMGDQAPRLTGIERRLNPKTVGKYGAVASLYPLLEWLYPIAEAWVKARFQ